MKLSDFSIRRPIFTLVTMILFLILGGVSLLNIPLQLIPDIRPPFAAVVASYPEANPTEVVENVTKPLENSLSTLPGLKSVSSTSQEGSSLTLLQFTMDTDLDNIQHDVLSRIEQTPLPDGVKPKFLKFDPSQFPIIQLALHSKGEEKAFRDAYEKLEEEFLKIPGVASVDMSGNTVDEIKIQLDQKKLEKYSLSQSDIVGVLQSNHLSVPGSVVTSGDQELTTRVVSLIHSTDEIKKLVIAQNPLTGKEIKLSDVAKVEKGPKEEKIITRANQEAAVLVSILQQSDANTAQVSKAFHERLDELLKDPTYKDVKADVLFDQGEYVNQSVGSMTEALIVGGLLAMAVLFFFLRNVKSPLIIGISIPFSVIVTFVLMYFADFSLNIMTLGGLALGIGMLVDNSIVVIENIYRHLSMGKDPKEAASVGAKEIAGAITASTLTTVVVFLPVVFVSGIIGNLFKEFAITIAFSLFASLVVAITVVPMLASRFLKAPKSNLEEKRRKGWFLQSISQAVRWSLSHRFIVLSLAFLLLIAGGLGLARVGTEFLPTSDMGFFMISVKLENGKKLEETENVVKKIEEILERESVVETHLSLIGRSRGGGPVEVSSSNEAQIFVKMIDFDKRDLSTAQFVDKVKDEIQGVDQEAEIELDLQSAMGGSSNTLTFNVRDNNEKRLEKSVAEIRNALSEMKEIRSIVDDQNETIEELQITVDRKKALEHGFMPAQIATTVRDVTRGVDALQITTDDAEVLMVHVAYDPKVSNSIDSLKNLLIKKPDGSYIKLKDVAKVSKGEGPIAINRIDQSKAVQFTLHFDAETNLGDLSNQVMKKIDALNLSDETEITFTGDHELLEDSLGELSKAFVLAVVFVYLVMAAQFESLRHPFVIMFSLPLVVIGVSIALNVTNTPIGATAMIGLVVLAGIVANNAIVLVDFINQQKEKGIVGFEAIVEAVVVRTRPILMTSITTILGLIPMAIGFGEGTEIQQPLGLSVIGGMISSTFLTLFVIPVVYSLFDKETRRHEKGKLAQG